MKVTPVWLLLATTLTLTLRYSDALTYRELLEVIDETDDDPYNSFELEEEDASVDNTTIYIRDIDDEVDGMYLLHKFAGESLGGEAKDLTRLQSHNDGLGFWRRRRRRRRRHHSNPCRCHKYGCSCCASQRFSVKVVFERFSKTLSVCVDVNYLPRNFGFEFKLRLNGRQVFRKEISLKHPPRMCYKVPGLGTFARVCAQIYNVDIARKSLCVKAVGVLDLKIKKFQVHLKIACFKIPILDDHMLTWIQEGQKQPEYLEMMSLPLLSTADVYKMIIEEYEMSK